MFTVADPGPDACEDVPVTVTDAGLGATVGDEYSPFASIVPFAAPPVTAHVTVWLLPLFTTAENCCCVADTGQVFPTSSA